MAIITNQELRDLWADAAKIKEAISDGKIAVADAAVLAKLEAMRGLLAGTLSTADSAVLAKLEAMRGLLAGTLSTADSAVLAKLADLEAKLDTILNGTTPAAVELTGRNVIEQSIFNALAISDTSFKYGTLVTTSGGKYQIRVRSTLDQPVLIGLSGIDGDRQRGTKTIRGSTLDDVTVTIPANSGPHSIIITPDTWAPLKGPLISLSLIAKCSVAPTTGSLTAVLVEV